MLLKNSQLYGRLRSAILPLAEIDKALPKQGKIMELGCGQGVIAKYLARRNGRLVLGIDSNRERISTSEKRNLHFRVGDITNIVYKPQDGFIISDVLHHISLKDQKSLLSKLNKALKKNGTLIIKEIDTSEFLRSKLSRFWDFTLYPGDKISYWNSNELKKYLTSLGFNVNLKKTSRLLPGSTTLFICRKSKSE